MDTRIDTLSSGRFDGQWAFLSSASHPGHARSLPQSSSYLRSSERSNISPLPTALQFYHLNASRSSLPRHAQTSSIGGHSVTTNPSPPVLVRINSDNAAIQSHPPSLIRIDHFNHAVRLRDHVMNDHNIQKNEIPPIHEFSIAGILASIEEEIEDDINAVSEILGRSRLVLADQHDSHLPPQGEIRATSSSLQAVAEASSSNERLAAADEVMILREDASLVDGSHTGSAAYGLLERLQAVPRTKGHRPGPGGAPISRAIARPSHHHALPAMPSEAFSPEEPQHAGSGAGTSLSSRHLLSHRTLRSEEDVPSRTTNAVVSETYLSAGANAITLSDPPIVSESGRQYPLYSYDYTEIFEGPPAPPARSHLTFRQRMQTLFTRQELQGSSFWDHRRGMHVASAESQLRGILDRQPQFTRRGTNLSSTHEDLELYQ